MKRSMFDSEYERVRRDAGLDKARYDFDSLDPPAQRWSPNVEELNEDFKRRMTALSIDEREKAAAAKAFTDEKSREYNKRFLMREYSDLGLVPPDPLVSLTLLLPIGWKIGRVGDEVVLLRPVFVKEPKRETHPCEMGS